MANQDQHTMQDPTTQYPKATPEWKQQQDEPGLQREMTPVPDAGEKSYKGSGRLTGRKAVVTGADSGIGRAAAIAFAREGADVVLAYLPEEEADAQEVVKLIEEAGRKAITMPGDLKDEKYCEELIESAVKELGGIDILANVAGKQQFVEQIADLTTEQFDATFKTNVYSMFWLCKACCETHEAGQAPLSTHHRFRRTNLRQSCWIMQQRRHPLTRSAKRWPNRWVAKGYVSTLLHQDRYGHRSRSWVDNQSISWPILAPIHRLVGQDNLLRWLRHLCSWQARNPAM